MAANEHSLPRLHLIGTLTIVMMLTVALGGYFSWRSAQEHQASIERVAQVLRAQQQERLQRELDSAISFLEFTRQRTDTVLRASLREQVDVAMQIVQAIHARESQRHPPEVVKRLIIEALRPVRFLPGARLLFHRRHAGALHPAADRAAARRPASPRQPGRPRPPDHARVGGGGPPA